MITLLLIYLSVQVIHFFMWCYILTYYTSTRDLIKSGEIEESFLKNDWAYRYEKYYIGFNEENTNVLLLFIASFFWIVFLPSYILHLFKIDKRSFKRRLKNRYNKTKAQQIEINSFVETLKKEETLPGASEEEYIKFAKDFLKKYN